MKKIVFWGSAALALFLLAVLLILPAHSAMAESNGLSIQMDGLSTGEGTDVLEILLTLTVIALIPSILIMTTCFTRIVIVLSCVRNAVGLQQTPPNQVLLGIALFLSLFIISPVIGQINETAYQPYQKGEITQVQAAEKAIVPLRGFMLKNTNAEDLNLFLDLGHYERPETTDQIETTVLIPAFITSELKRRSAARLWPPRFDMAQCKHRPNRSVKGSTASTENDHESHHYNNTRIDTQFRTSLCRRQSPDLGASHRAH
jgi:flagellar biosynthesis protein FliP